MTETRKRRFSSLHDDNEEENNDNDLENQACKSSVTKEPVSLDCHDERNSYSEHSEDDEEGGEQEEDPEDEDDDDFAPSGDNAKFIGVKGKANKIVNQPDSTFKDSYESLGDQAKLSESDRFFVRTGKGYANFLEFDDIDGILNHLGSKYHSVSHISKLELNKIYEKISNAPTTTQVLRNL